jgi:CRP-like cAMP-binding protein
MSGFVEIYRKQGNREEVIARLGRGEIIGEMSLIDNQPRIASARVLEGGQVSIIDQADFISRLDKLGESDRVLRRVIDVLVNRIRGEGGTQV